MGVAGVAMLGAIISFFMSIVSAVKYIYWKKTSVPATGVIGAKIDTQVNYKGEIVEKIASTEYIYEFVVSWPDGKCATTYTDTVSGEKDSNVNSGDQVPVFWNASRKIYQDARHLKKNLLQYPATFVVCIAILVVCFFIVDVLG